MPEEKEYGFDIVREGSDVILKVNYEKVISPPSIEEDPVCMSRTIDMLLEAGKVTKIVFEQKRDFEYDFDQVKIIQELAVLYNKFVKNHELMTFLLSTDKPAAKPKQALLQNFVYSVMKKDPIGAYVLIRRERREQEHILESVPNHLDKELIQA